MALVPRALTAAALALALAAGLGGTTGCVAAADGAAQGDEDEDGIPEDGDADGGEEVDQGAEALSQKPFVHGLFRSQMVLQRGDSKLKVWGFAGAGTSVRVRIESLGYDRTVKANSKGRWSAKLGSLSAGGPHNIEISRAGEHVELTDVLVGDVYLVAGQSNAHRSFGHYPEDPAISSKWQERAAEERQGCVEPRIRFWKTKTGTPHSFPKSPRRTPVPHFDSGWTSCNEAVASDVSAMGYVMARELAKTTDAPIGLVQATIPATRIECWLQKGKTDPSATNASRCYNSMIAPLRGARFKSVLWYQGEGNAGRVASTKYRGQLDVLLTTWRGAFADPSLPFAIVRLAPFSQGGDADTWWARVQKAQEIVAAKRNEATIVKLDADTPEERKTIHPPDKWEAGRAAAAAMRRLETGEF